MSAPTLAEVIAHDVAVKCGNDVADTIRRSFQLCDSQSACVMAAISGVAFAMAQLAGAMWADADEPVPPEVLDKLWNDLLKPLSITAMTGLPANFSALKASVAAKPFRINGGLGA